MKHKPPTSKPASPHRSEANPEGKSKTARAPRPVPKMSAEMSAFLEAIYKSGNFTLEKAAEMYKDIEPIRKK